VTTAVTVVVASLAGYALARLPIRGTGAILAFILLAGFFPVLAMIGPLFLMLRYIGALNNIYPLIIVYLVYTLPISTWLLKNFFQQIPADLEDAALTDGATRLQVLRKVIIPVAVPGVFTAAILSFILAWNDFAFAVSFLTSTSNFTAPLAITTFGQSGYQTYYNLIDAAVVIISIPIALLVLLAQRRIVAGLTAGSFR
jgi:ABC-type glycerol-3-phosphate transport system permease component